MAGDDRVQTGDSLAVERALNGRPDEAMTLFREAFKAGARRPDILTKLIPPLNRAGRPELALEAIEMWVNSGTQDPGLFLLQARQLSAIGRAPEALAPIRKVNASGSSFPGQDLLFAEVLAAAGEFVDCVEVSCKLLSAAFENPRLHNLVGYCLERGFADGGEKTLRQRIRKNSADAPAMYHLAMLLLRRGAWQESASVISACLALQPHSTLAADVAARCHVFLGEYGVAAGLYRRIWDAAAKALPAFPALTSPAKPTASTLPILYLPVEIVGREFLTRLLIADQAVARRFTCVVLGHNAIKAHGARLPAGIILHKGLNSLDVGFFREAAKAGHIITAIDEEAFAWTGGARPLMRGLDRRALELCEAVFCPGREYAEEVAACLPETSGKLIVTGNPRVDIFSARFAPLFSHEVHEIRNTHGDYFLLCTNVGCWNSAVHAYSNGCQLELMAPGATMDSDYGRWILDSCKDSMECELENTAGLRAALPVLAKAFPTKTIIVRPHPTEDFTTWRNIAAGLDNVKVDGTASLAAQILAAEAVIHFPGCGTGIEALLLGRPAFSFDTLDEHRHPTYGLSWYTSPRAHNTTTLIEMLKSASPQSISEDQESRIARSIEGSRGLASEKIVEHLKALYEKRAGCSPENGESGGLRRRDELGHTLAKVAAFMSSEEIQLSRTDRLKRVAVSREHIETTLAEMAVCLGRDNARPISVDRVAEGYFILERK